MRRWFLLLGAALGSFGCGDDSGTPDASSDATIDVQEEPFDAAEEPDVDLDAPPERAIWVASPTTLYTFDPETHIVKRIADFDCSSEPMVDLAMNEKEELFGVTSESIVRIDKVTGECTVLARGSQVLPYATGFVPATSLEAGVEKWLGYRYVTMSAIDPDSGALAYAGVLGGKVGNFNASGDIVSLAGGKTFMTAFDLNPNQGDAILEIDPNTGAETVLEGFSGEEGLLGLAQWAGTLYVFSNQGHVYFANVSDAGLNIKQVALTYDFGDASIEAGSTTSDAGDAGDAATDATPFFISFRGAAVTTRAPVSN
jgi:hypothetical protein